MASSIAILLRIKPEVLIKWLATQDTGTVIVAVRAMNFKPDLFKQIYSSLPWRDKVSVEDAEASAVKYDLLSQKDANDIFEMWRAHSFFKNGNPERQQSVNVA